MTQHKSKSFWRPFQKNYTIPGERKLDAILHHLNRPERAILTLLVVVFVVSAVGLTIKLNTHLLESVPVQGGEVVEGVIGVPRAINPLLASSEADRDLVALIYSGLMRPSPRNTLVPDLAESYEISEDGTTYTFTLKDNLTWHDGEVITSDDIIFTVQKAQDSIVKSVKRADWDGVAVERVDARTVRFTLPEAFSPFLQNTTLGILPKHLWEDVDPEIFSDSKLNDSPIGSGPYKVGRIKRDRDGIPEYYSLRAFDNFALGTPYITTMQLRFYPNELALIDALANEEILNINSIAPDEVNVFEETHIVLRTPLPRVFGAFYNQNQSKLFTDRAVRRALNESVDRERIVDTILQGYGSAIDGPLPPGSLGYSAPPSDVQSSEDRLAAANALLNDAGWARGDEGVRSGKVDGDTQELTFAISTSDTPELKQAAAMLANTWEKLGARVEVKIFEQGDLESSVIRPRKYDVLLFGEIIGRDADPYAFWHSSQRLDPGLNIALYTNITVDEALELARTTTDLEQRIAEYEVVQKEIRHDIPATFIYTPDFIYITHPSIRAVNLGVVTVPSERFLDIHTWYIETDTVWRAYAQDEDIATQ